MPRLRIPRLVFVAAVLLGVFVGLGGFTFYYAEGFSYFSEQPQTCVNCHVMQEQYDEWIASGHHHVATCNDCHLPAGGVGKYIAKARNGWNHSLAFTTDNYPKPIRITPKNIEILQDNCVRCHSDLVHDAIIIPAGGHGEAQSCLHCHRSVGHGPNR